MAYTTVESLKVHLQIAEDIETDDELLGELLEQAQASIETSTHRVFEADEDTSRMFWAPDRVYGRKLLFDGDICQITTITNGDGQVIDADQYRTLPRNTTPLYGVELVRDAQHYWYEDIEVLGRWSYSITPPADIVRATIRLATFFYRMRENMQDLDRAIVTAGATILPQTIPSDILRTISHYIPKVP